MSLTLITDNDPTAVTHPAWARFEQALLAKKPRHCSMLDAWTWFREGWDEKSRQLQAAATNEWCDTW
jgi:hypothetical protein